MAGGIDWFRWRHGSVTDPKFQLVARKAGASLAEVLAVWALLLEMASQNRASVAKFDDEQVDMLLGMKQFTALSIYRELAFRGFIVKDSIAKPRRYFPAPSLRPSGGIWQKLRTAVFERDRYTCQYCGDRGAPLECDHVVPVADGGAHDKENLTTACRPCNRAKGARTVAQWKGGR